MKSTLGGLRIPKKYKRLSTPYRLIARPIPLSEILADFLVDFVFTKLGFIKESFFFFLKMEKI
ncbi:hypothetical protein P700755_001420 [Psychroflexus torquis ATCC 700755]|uniref:Uncharacterized protein n=1 Tax=Psychroflexus torquis (strain ATCC 700755 / CIP 106069 / ACAM 623) TaxID=313595 RepID=K4IGY6_PSYTT|nr:hypothetical protein [Psychroflexus torquis]AFU68336.1 hypothetical protein P700755_001420 [Psychroflexus torquis ATCC 700755]